MSKVMYLASPYTHKLSLIREYRYRAVMENTARLLSAGKLVYSPITHCHEMAVHYNLPKDFEFWMNYDHAMIERCEVFGVLLLPDWTKSEGVQAEIAYAKQLEKPIAMLDPEGYYAEELRKLAESLY